MRQPVGAALCGRLIEEPTEGLPYVSYPIPMNLMEGAHRLSSKEYRQFVGISRGSAGEMKYQLVLAKDLNYISGDQYSNLIPKYERVSQMLTKLSKSLE